MIFNRNLRFKIEKALQRSPVVLITGARQTGKTTLTQQLSDKKYNYITFDDMRSLSAAKSNPIGFLEDASKPIILDEVQRVPELFLSIKHYVDQHRIPGSFILTGSANPLLIPRLGDSLAGRMEIFYLFPLSQGELHNRQETFLDALFDADFASLVPTAITKDALIKKISIGGYPPVQKFDAQGADSWFDAYLTTILQRDVQDLARIEGIAQLPNLLSVFAARTGSLFNFSELSRQAAIPNSTIIRYTTLLETLFLIVFLQPWSTNFGKRLVKSPKSYIVDTGILLHVLKVDIQRLKSDTTLLGKIVENFVIIELIKQASWYKKRVQAFHYRSQVGQEVDILLEDSTGNVICIEIKASETVTSDDFKGLRHVKTELQKKFVCGVVLYTGTEKVPFGGNLWALPISCLWA